MEHYAGRWYEIARLPLIWEAGCEQATADYAWQAGYLRVINSCYQHGRLVRQDRGWARPYDTADWPIKLRLQFESYPVPSDYWIEETDFDNYSIVGGPKRDHLWLLARSPVIPYALFEYFTERAEELGYDLENLEITGKIFQPQ